MSAKKTLGHAFGAKVRTVDVESKDSSDFKDLLLSETTLNGLHNAGFDRPSPIQLEAVPLGKCGLDLIVQAKSGTGKTCVFVVCALEMIQTSHKGIQVLILAPTREVAVQICDVTLKIGEYYKELKVKSFIGGLPLKEDVKKLKLCHIAVGTPGRIRQLIKNGNMKTDSIKLIVLDEADKLISASLQDDINWIYSSLPENKQMMTLSATYSEALVKFITKYMISPTIVRLNSDDPALLGITQYFKFSKFHGAPHMSLKNKVDAVVNIFCSISFNQCLVFTNYQLRAENVCDMLVQKGWSSTYICSSQTQEKRLNVISQLKNVECRILVSTDLATHAINRGYGISARCTARGIDAENVDLVIHVDVPWDGETLFHRMGRAGRFGAQGISIVIVNNDNELEQLAKIQKDKNLKIYTLPDDLHDIWNHKPTPESHFNNYSLKRKECEKYSKECNKPGSEEIPEQSLPIFAENICEENLHDVIPSGLLNSQNEMTTKKFFKKDISSEDVNSVKSEKRNTKLFNENEELQAVRSYLINQRLNFIREHGGTISNILKNKDTFNQIVEYYNFVNSSKNSVNFKSDVKICGFSDSIEVSEANKIPLRLEKITDDSNIKNETNVNLPSCNSEIFIDSDSDDEWRRRKEIEANLKSNKFYKVPSRFKNETNKIPSCNSEICKLSDGDNEWKARKKEIEIQANFSPNSTYSPLNCVDDNADFF
ncbi:putative ATP-dependent RNA helicase DDX20 [Nymphon striatum]|nr:putative ATP-dependent RNA helicase DDX20 [Nymphon striatum]